MYQINEGSLQLPPSWKDQTVNVMLTVGIGEKGLSFTISRDTLPWGMSFESFAKKEIDSIATTLKGYQSIANVPMLIDGQPATRSEFKWMSPQGLVHQSMVITAKASKVLVFTASMPEMLSAEQQEEIAKILETFKFADEQAT